MLYLAAPYTHESEKVVWDRVSSINTVFGKFIAAGIHAYSPITKSHHIQVLHGDDLGLNWGQWMKLDLRILKECHALVVLQLEGWRESKGVAIEIETAKELGMAVHYVQLSEVDSFIQRYSTRTLLALTGPAGTGKTEFLKVASRMNCPVHESGDPLRNLFARLLGEDEWNDKLESAKRMEREFKIKIKYQISELESIDEYVSGISTKVRQGIIHLAEKVVKPILGHQTFPRHAAKLLNQYMNAPVLVTASAFQMELDVLREEFIGNVIVVGLTRGNANYAGDSREPVTPNIIINNNGSLEDYHKKVRLVINQYSV